MKCTSFLKTAGLFLFLMLAGVSIARGQHLVTEYWQFVKTYYKNGTVQVSSDNMGQFIARNENICYDADKRGSTIGNGTLKAVVRQNGVIKYVGPCYYGRDCTYTFYLNEGILNIEDTAGNVYVYQRKQAPAGKETSSLIRGLGGGYAPGAPATTSPATPQGEEGGGHGKTRHPKTCSKCFGKRICTTCNGTGVTYSITYANNQYTTCPACSGSKVCSLCGGQGTYGYDYY